MLRRFVCIILGSLLGATQQPAAYDKTGELQDLFVTANVEFTLRHELTHALISAFDVPVLGSEEHAADQIATIGFLHPTDKNGRDPRTIEKLVAVADAWRLEWELDKDSGGTAYWFAHTLTLNWQNGDQWTKRASRDA